MGYVTVMYRELWLWALCALLMMPGLTLAQGTKAPTGETYLPVVIEEDFQTIRQRDIAAKPEVMQRQTTLLNERYDLSERPAAGVMMSGGRKPVQEGVRVKLPQGMTWERLAATTPNRRAHQNLHAARYQGLPAVSTRWTAPDAGGYGGVFQSRVRLAAECAGEERPSGVHAPTRAAGSSGERRLRCG